MLAVGILAMSSSSILIRWAQDEGTPSLIIATYRLTIATCVLSIPIFQRHGRQEYAKMDRQTVIWVLLSGTLLGFHFVTWITSLSHITVMSSVVLVTTTPLWIGLASPLLLGEHIPRSMWRSLIVAMLGVSLIGLAGWKDTLSQAMAGDVLALLGAIFAAGYLIIGRKLRTTLSLLSYLWLVYGTAAAFLLIWSLVSHLSLVGYTLTATICMIILGIVPQLIGHSLANYAIRHLSATFVGITILGEPVGATVLAAWLLQETPHSPLQILGGAITLAAIASASLAERNRGSTTA